MKRKVAIYARVSTEHEAQLSALENQVQYYDDILKKNPDWILYDKKTGESKSKVIKSSALIYNSGDFYIDIDQINTFNAIQILFCTVPEESLFRMPLFPQFIYKNYLCAWGGKVQGYFVGHRFVREETLKEAFPYHKNQSNIVKRKIQKKYHL